MKTRPHLVPALFASVMLLLAVAPLPYGYYQFLRWVICAVAVFVAVTAYSWKQQWATWLFGIIAILFNPIAPIYLTRAIWQPIDLTGAAMFILSIFLVHDMVKR